MNPRDLIKTAQDLIGSGKGKPRQSNLRRAVSTTYYAMFHALAKSCADLLIGSSTKNSIAWQQAYRALEHRFAKNACSNGNLMQSFSQEVQDFANLFVQMQEKRHRADYDPYEKIYKSSVLVDIAAVEAAIDDFAKASVDDRRAFVAAVLLKRRS